MTTSRKRTYSRVYHSNPVYDGVDVESVAIEMRRPGIWSVVVGTVDGESYESDDEYRSLQEAFSGCLESLGMK